MVKLDNIHVKDIQKNRYLYAIYRVMKKIGENYSAIITKGDEGDESKIKICERNYIIYLSYILGSLQGTNKYLRFKENDFVNGEICKFFDAYENDNSIRKAYERFVKYKDPKIEICEIKDKRILPDFVIHSSHDEDFEIDGQKLIIEAKTTSKLDKYSFCWDMLKLHYYLRNLKFNDAVYILINTKKDKIEEMAGLFYNKIYPNCRNRQKLWLFVQNWNGDKIAPVKVYQIQNKTK